MRAKRDRSSGIVPDESAKMRRSMLRSKKTSRHQATYWLLPMEHCSTVADLADISRDIEMLDLVPEPHGPAERKAGIVMVPLP